MERESHQNMFLKEKCMHSRQTFLLCAIIWGIMKHCCDRDVPKSGFQTHFMQKLEGYAV